MGIYPLRKAGFYPSDNEFQEIDYLILASFFPEADEKTIKEIEERSGYSYERVYTALKKLEKKNILAERKVGKTLTYRIVSKDNIVEFAFVHFSIVKKAKFSEKYPQASKALDDLLSKVKVDLAMVFGSYARGEAKKRSDLDLLCVSQNKNIEETALSLRHKYNLKINPVVVEFNEFKNIKNENPEFWQDLAEFGVIFKGYEFFYHIIYR